MTTHHIQMALATEGDMEVGYALAHLIEALSRGNYLPVNDEENAPDWFDEDDVDHLRALHKRIVELGNESGSLWRILGGWSCVTNPKNKLLDLTKNVVDFHPRISAADDLLQVAREALSVIRVIKPPENGNGTIVRLEEAIAKATGA